MFEFPDPEAWILSIATPPSIASALPARSIFAPSVATARTVELAVVDRLVPLLMEALDEEEVAPFALPEAIHPLLKARKHENKTKI